MTHISDSVHIKTSDFEMRAIRAERRSVRSNPMRMLDFGHPPQELQLQVIALTTT